MHRWRLILPTGFLFLAPAAGHADPEWTSLGPDGSNITALTIDPSNPSTVYAADNGLLKSTNGGANWSEDGFFATYGFVIDPTNSSTLYAATDDQGVWKTTNGGTNWTWLKTGLTLAFVHTLAIDPATPTTVYAGTSSGNGVYKSTNTPPYQHSSPRPHEPHHHIRGHSSQGRLPVLSRPDSRW